MATEEAGEGAEETAAAAEPTRLLATRTTACFPKSAAEETEAGAEGEAPPLSPPTRRRLPSSPLPWILLLLPLPRGGAGSPARAEAEELRSSSNSSDSSSGSGLGAGRRPTARPLLLLPPALPPREEATAAAAASSTTPRPRARRCAAFGRLSGGTPTEPEEERHPPLGPRRRPRPRRRRRRSPRRPRSPLPLPTSPCASSTLRHLLSGALCPRTRAPRRQGPRRTPRRWL
jgi:hypothetical protein